MTDFQPDWPFLTIMMKITSFSCLKSVFFRQFPPLFLHRNLKKNHNYNCYFSTSLSFHAYLIRLSFDRYHNVNQIDISIWQVPYCESDRYIYLTGTILWIGYINLFDRYHIVNRIDISIWQVPYCESDRYIYLTGTILWIG